MVILVLLKNSCGVVSLALLIPPKLSGLQLCEHLNTSYILLLVKQRRYKNSWLIRCLFQKPIIKWTDRCHSILFWRSKRPPVIVCFCKLRPNYFPETDVLIFHSNCMFFYYLCGAMTENRIIFIFCYTNWMFTISFPFWHIMNSVLCSHANFSYCLLPLFFRDISYNDLSGDLPIFLDQLSALTYLYVCNITSIFIKNIDITN